MPLSLFYTMNKDLKVYKKKTKNFKQSASPIGNNVTEKKNIASIF